MDTEIKTKKLPDGVIIRVHNEAQYAPMATNGPYAEVLLGLKAKTSCDMPVEKAKQIRVLIQRLRVLHRDEGVAFRTRIIKNEEGDKILRVVRLQ